jgi:hypothetical protein
MFCNPHPDYQTVAEESTNLELPPASSNKESEPGESDSECNSNAAKYDDFPLRYGQTTIALLKRSTALILTFSMMPLDMIRLIPLSIDL